MGNRTCTGSTKPAAGSLPLGLFSHPVVKYLAGSVSVPMVLTASALLVYTPYLRGLGAQGFPVPGIGVHAVLVACAFLLLSGGAGVGGAMLAREAARRLPRSARTRGVAVGVLGTLLALVNLLWLRSCRSLASGTSTPADLDRWLVGVALSAWLAAAAGAGAVAYLSYTSLMTGAMSGNCYQRASRALLTAATVGALVIWGAHPYSASLFLLLPPVLGGAEPRSVVFPRAGGPGAWPHGAVVWLLYEDRTHYWVQYLNSNKDGYIVDRFGKVVVGDPVTTDTNTRPERRQSRRVRWQLKFEVPRDE